jgi:hypothetical protein
MRRGLKELLGRTCAQLLQQPVTQVRELTSSVNRFSNACWLYGTTLKWIARVSREEVHVQVRNDVQWLSTRTNRAGGTVTQGLPFSWGIPFAQEASLFVCGLTFELSGKARIDARISYLSIR